MTHRPPLGWDQLFAQRHAGTDSLLPYLLAARLLATSASVVVNVGCGRGGLGVDLPGLLGDFAVRAVE